MLPGRKITLGEVVRSVRRKLPVLLLLLLAGMVAGVYAYLQTPAVYRSEAVMMAVPQRLADNYVKPSVTTSVEDRLRSMTEQVQTRSRLAKIIVDYNLYPDMRKKGMTDDVVNRLRSDIDLGFESNELSFRLIYTNADPRLAQRVNERLAALFLEENLRERESVADGTSKFLDAELLTAKQRLMEKEQKLEEYKRTYAGQLPSQMQGNLQGAQNAQSQVASLMESIDRARERRLLLERQIDDVQAALSGLVVPGAQVPTAPNSSGTASQQLEAAKGRLADLKLRYTDDYPDVKAAQQEVRDLQAKVDEQARRPSSAASPAEAAQRKRLRDLQSEQRAVNQQIASAQGDMSRLQRVMSGYQANVAVVPARESELIELTRDLTSLQQAYSALLQKSDDAKVAANLERRQIAEQFKLLDPASLPTRPANQHIRLAILLAGPVGGLGLGLLLLGFIEYRDSSFRREEDVVRILSLPVLALIPPMKASSDRRDRTPVHTVQP